MFKQTLLTWSCNRKDQYGKSGTGADIDKADANLTVCGIRGVDLHVEGCRSRAQQHFVEQVAHGVPCRRGVGADVEGRQPRAQRHFVEQVADGFVAALAAVLADDRLESGGVDGAVALGARQAEERERPILAARESSSATT